MASSRQSTLNNVALFTSGALVGAGLYTLARNLVSQRKTEHVAIESHAPERAQSEPVAPAADEPLNPIDLYNECGAMGIPYLPRTQISHVPAIDTKMDQEPVEPLAAPHVELLSPTFDTPLLITAQLAIEMIAYDHSDTIFSYESAASGGFGAYCEALHAQDKRHGPVVYAMQSRAGAGAAIAGYLAGEGCAAQSASQAHPTVTVLTNAQSFCFMGPALARMQSESRGNLVVHVSSVSHTASLDVVNDYASSLATAAMLGESGFQVLLSASRAEAVEFAQYTYTRERKGPIVHIFDGAFAAAELGRTVVPRGVVPQPAPFSYTGPTSPASVLLLPNGTLALKARAMLLSLPPAQRGKVGVVCMRMLSPWNAADLAKVLPASVKLVRVVEEAYAAMSGALYTAVLESALSGALGKRTIHSLTLPSGEEMDCSAWHVLLIEAASTPAPLSMQHILSKAADAVKLPDILALSGAQLITLFGADHGETAATANALAKRMFDANEKRSLRLLTRYDNYHAAGAVRCDLVFTERAESDIPVEVLAAGASSHMLVVSEPKQMLDAYKLVDAVCPNGTILFNASEWTLEDVDAALPPSDKRVLASRDASVFVVDVSGSKDKMTDASERLLDAIVCATKQSPKNALSNTPLLASAPSSVALEAKQYNPAAWASAQFDTPDDAKRAEARLRNASYTGFTPAQSADSAGPGVAVSRASWALAAWQMLFREAYGLNAQALRPDLPDKTYNVVVSVNKRLTPLDYDRNLFHMELDTTGTGLKYEVGEALGVHGWNDDAKVHAFIAWSGYNADDIVRAPSVLYPGHFESRTVFQVLQQNLDIFGKPPKSFFGALGKEVTSKDEARWLRFISAAEGNSTFKKLSELETVTYVDVLHMFPTAHVSVDWLAANVEPIKPRHYSIASAQVAVGDRVDLLIVTVDWKNAQGATQFGQCTKYLSQLRPGAKVTVSIKPSVMKLPPLETQPIIMAGLGTGAAPFRAFLQARAYQRAQGREVGPLYYYFGSRYQSAEYLYGEELEAYLTDGLLTHLGLAFSRDQKKKVYIQHKIQEDGHMLTEFLAPELANGDSGAEQAAIDLVEEGRKGIFTLCGPVWPVPDIQEALVSSFIARGWTKEQAEKKLETLKEEERYVLEVY
ncbi:assimilatory sulfite reductase (NADPH) [Malassezia vespertilionis]|uniref:assimilatory sulfite reductase (NADPH) n=1 Tax=Malassezia vespertilionis TaxID=2020962 RepID=A0A2N1JAY5_9BASI|nr:assimilatory sulfite reductase (NADPH) [Malassezia vespertilionis]PKI83720.1 hypothetical protein MVES_002635 [Malassezia vespertilionis]WFD07425.1 assimilatory sulfite reductase (NADPH) [Malassezia vespertilionis]